MMNEEVQKIIKSSFCPKEKWIKDQNAYNCFKCDKKFHSLIRRKHHCRYCGQVFCAACSDFYLPGKDLGEPEKTIRMCEACLQKCWKYIAKHDETYLEFRKSGDHEKQKMPQNLNEIQEQTKSFILSQEYKLKEIQSILEEYQAEKEKGGNKKLEEEVSKKFAILLQVILKQAKIPLKYFEEIHRICLEVMSKVPINFVISSTMNICQNIRFKTFLNDEFKLSLDDVVLIRKCFNSKKIKDQYQNLTCILVYGNIESVDLVGNDKEASFENMIKYRLNQMGKILSCFERNKINIIFLQGNIEKEFQDQFFKNNIVIIPKVKIENLTRLKIGLKIQKIVDSIGKVHQYPEKQIAGTISKMTSCSYISRKDQNITKKFFKITAMKPELSLTLTMQSPDTKLLESLKKEFKQILQTLIHVNLTFHRIKLDQNLLESMTESLKKSCLVNNPELFFNIYQQNHNDILNYIKERYISYKYITYVESNFDCYPEVTKGDVHQYLKNRTHSFKNKWENFTEICDSIHDEHRMFYSEYDVPLGNFLLKKLTSIDKKCSICCRPNYLHTEMYYSTDQYVKIWTESRIIDYSEKESSYNSSFGSIDDGKHTEMEMIFTYLEKTNSKDKLKCYIECFECQEPISNRENVYKEDLEFSTLGFLHHMFKGSIETTIRQNNSKKNAYSKQKMVCNHIKKIRVYELGEKSVKIFVGKYTISRQCLLTDTGRLNFLKAKEDMYIKEFCVVQTSRIEKFVAFLYDEIKSIAEMSKNSKFDTMIKNPKSSFINARRTIVGNANVRLSQAQCIDMILPELIQEVTKINNVAILSMNSKRISKYLEALKIYHIFMSLLKKSYLIINEVKKAVKKRDLDMKYQAKDFDKDFCMEEIDINAYIDNSSVDNSESERDSQISKSELYSNYQGVDCQNSTVETADHSWLQSYKDQPQPLSRHDRKTESNILAKKNNKASEEEVFKVFKYVSSYLKVEYAYFDFTPCYPNKPQTLIASSLNSQQHKEAITSHQNFTQIFIKMSQYMESDVLTTENQDIKKLSQIMEIHQKMFEINDKHKKQNSGVLYEICMLFPIEFEILRKRKNIGLELFIESVAGSEHWLTSGGKSGSPFLRSFNDLIVIKKIPKGEFLTFKKFLPKYFTHLHEGSILTPIYGAYTLTRNSTTDYYVVMENLFFGMKEWYLYDFKGSVTRRFSKPPVIPLDINYLIDRNSQPIFSKENVLKHLNSTLEYLSENKVIDYSLILVVEIENNNDYYLDGNRFQIGVVDYMREFGVGERVQNMWKGPEATVVEPSTYKSRMLKNLKKYFTQIPL